MHVWHETCVICMGVSERTQYLHTRKNALCFFMKTAKKSCNQLICLGLHHCIPTDTYVCINEALMVPSAALKHQSVYQYNSHFFHIGYASQSAITPKKIITTDLADKTTRSQYPELFPSFAQCAWAWTNSCVKMFSLKWPTTAQNTQG